MKRSEVRDLHPVAVRNERGEPDTAVLKLRYRRILILPPGDKQKRYPELVLTVIHARKNGKPRDRERIDWKLLTDLPVRSCLARHTYGTVTMKETRNVFAVADSMGHVDLKSMAPYQHQEIDPLREAIKRRNQARKAAPVTQPHEAKIPGTILGR